MSDLFVRYSLAPSTKNSYRSGLNAYLLFCHQAGISSFPVCHQNLCSFASHLSHSVSFKTIKTYLASIQFVSIALGFPQHIKDFDRLHYVLRGIRRFQGSIFSRPKRGAISKHHLKAIVRFLSLSTLHPQDKALFLAASLIAFFGLLRVSEYTYDNFNPSDSNSLMLSDTSIKGSIIFLHIRSSKTDPFRQGTTIRIPSINSELCPVVALQNFLSFRGLSQGPLFRFHDGGQLQRGHMQWLLRQIPGSLNLNTHSFRIGGATAASAAGIPDSTIQILGRWSSNAFKNYIRFSDDTIKALGTRMSNATGSDTVWQPYT